MRKVTSRGYDLIGYEIEGSPPVEDLELGIKAIDQASRPMAPADLKAALAKMFALTKRRRDDQADLTMIVAAYAEQLIKHPGDIVAEVLEDWPNRSKWFPAWQELADAISWRNRRGKMRQAMVEKLHDTVADPIKDLARQAIAR